MKELKALSLFANVGIGETYLHDLGIKTVVANELLQERVDIYKHLYPDTNMIQGDITQSNVFDNIVQSAVKEGVNVIIATPPCQGMSIAGRQQADEGSEDAPLLRDVFPRTSDELKVLLS